MKKLAIVLLLLLLHLFLRSHQLMLQDPYIDEGYHATRAAVVWDMEQNPARFSHGKLLLYFWLGIFETEPRLMLYSSRLAVGLFSLLSAAAVYQVGKLLKDHRTGLLALLLYSLLPLAFFYERMAMADPFASAFACLVAWRSLVLLRKPSLPQGLLLGLLLAGASMAKLTMALLPLLPLAALLLYRRPLRPYLRPFAAAAGLMVAAWLPFLLPAYLARHSAEPFILVNPPNLTSPGERYASLSSYLGEIMPLVTDFTGGLLLGLALLLLAAILFSRRHLPPSLAFLLAWAFSVTALTFSVSALPSSRYYMPLAAPLVLLLAWLLVELQARPGWGRALSYASLGLLLFWAGSFALPFLHRSMSAPFNPNLNGTNYNEFLSGWISGDDTIRSVAAELSAGDDKPIYTSWMLCELFYFYMDKPVHCLRPQPTPEEVLALMQGHPDSEVYFILFDEDVPVLEVASREAAVEGVELLHWYERKNTNRPLWLWRAKGPHSPQGLPLKRMSAALGS